MKTYSVVDFSTDRIVLSEQMDRMLSELRSSTEALCPSVKVPKSNVGISLPNAWSYRTGCFIWNWCALLVRFRDESGIRLDAAACLARIELDYLRAVCSPGGEAGSWEEGLAMRKYIDQEFPLQEEMNSKLKYSYIIIPLVSVFHSYIQHPSI